MQRAKFTVLRWAWAGVGRAPALDEPSEFEPHAAIAMAVAIAAAVRAEGRHARRGRQMTRVLSFIVPLSGSDPCGLYIGVVVAQLRIVREPEIKLKRSGSSAVLQAGVVDDRRAVGEPIEQVDQYSGGAHNGPLGADGLEAYFRRADPSR